MQTIIFFDANSKLLELSDEEFDNMQKIIKSVPSKAMVGSLMSRMVGTKAHLAFVVNKVNRFMSKASPPYWMDVKMHHEVI